MRYCLFGMCLVALVAGCMPRTVVRPNPGPHDKGVRYYRPKPYLLVQPTPAEEGGELRHDKYVQISLDYLPDFSEEYAIDVRTGLGKNKTSIKLADGWNLTEINQELDSSFDENVKAVGDLLSAVAPGGIVPTAGNDSQGPRMVVKATNVPIGYYESVIGRGPDCKKHLYGWRYVGFYPYAACPLSATGGECVDCHLSGLYGLVFREGVMTFEIIHAIAQTSASATRQVPAKVPHGLPLSQGVLSALAWRAADAVTKQFAIPPEGLVVNVEESGPHLVFTLVSGDAKSLKSLLDTHEVELSVTLNRIVREETHHPRPALVRVLSKDSLPEPVSADAEPAPVRATLD